MAISVTSIAPVLIDAYGGTKFIIQGDFAEHLGQLFTASLVPAGGGTSLDCLSGIPGRPTSIYPLNSTRMVCYAPQTTAGTTYDLIVTLIANALVTDTLASVVTALTRQYNSSVFALRSILPPNYKTGPRRFEQLEQIP